MVASKEACSLASTKCLSKLLSEQEERLVSILDFFQGELIYTEKY